MKNENNLRDHILFSLDPDNYRLCIICNFYYNISKTMQFLHSISSWQHDPGMKKNNCAICRTPNLYLKMSYFGIPIHRLEEIYEYTEKKIIVIDDEMVLKIS